jgi:NhaP-type Na+/H+ or K+/H+ antiporter
MDEHLYLLLIVLVPCLGVLAQWLAWRLQIPSILLLLAFGMIVGIWISPDEILTRLTGGGDAVGPRLLFPLVSVAVAVILFEGGMTLRWGQLGESARVLVRLLSLAALVTWGLTALLGHYLLGFRWPVAALLGAILIVTGPTVVGPLLRQIRPKRRVSSILQWEGILIDPLGAVAAVLVFEAISQTEGVRWPAIVGIVVQTLAIGTVLGLGSAALLVIALRRYWVPDFLHGVFVLAVALVAFWGSDLLSAESGLVTVTVLGVCLANQRYVSVDHVLEFKEHLRVLLIGCLFIVLGARIPLSSLAALGWAGVLFVLLLVLVVRPMAVFLSTWGTGLKWRETLFVGLVAPRGIVAASVASVFGLRLAALDSSVAAEPVTATQAQLLAPVTFLVILGTVTLCGLGAGPLARRLRLADANPQGILFAGASRWVRDVAAALSKLQVRVLLVDTNYANVTAARLAGLPATCASILSEHFQETEDLAGIGRLLAVTPNDEVNTLAAMEYVHVFSRANVYQLAPRARTHSRWQTVPETRRGRSLFQTDLTHQQLEQLMATGGVVKTTALTASFTWADFRTLYGEAALVLFAVDASKRLKIRTPQGSFQPAPGDRVVAIVPPAGDESDTPGPAHDDRPPAGGNA